MPLRIGFSQHRSMLLKRELERVVQELPSLGASKVIAIGDLPRGRVSPGSILQLIVVQDLGLNYLDRIDFFTSHLRPLVGIDISVYTPSEFAELKKTNLFVISSLRNGWAMYEE